MKKYSLPTKKQCFDIIKKYGLAPHIVAHSLAVAKLGVFLAERLKEKGICVDSNLVEAACLLHDVARPCDFGESDCNAFAEQSYGFLPEDKTKWRQLKSEYEDLCHEEIAYELLRREYPELASTVKKHRYTAILDEKEKPATWEEKLVYYADKRVMHDKIVPLKERLEEAHKRNIHLREGQTQSDIITWKVDPLIFALEEEIFSRLDITPDLPELA